MGYRPETPLNKNDYIVEPITHKEATTLIEKYHYSKGVSNTSVARHGLFHVSDPTTLLGVALWLPPTKSAALATYPDDWQAVLSLSRLVVVPEVPTNGASFLMSKSIKLIKQDKRWKCLVTYADTWRGHTGAIYKATNWKYVGETQPHEVWIDPAADRLVARKAGPKTRTKQQMLDLGYISLGRHVKHKFTINL